MAGSPRFARAIVTGGAGFLGSHLCERLVRQGTEVICLDNMLTGDEDNIAHLLPELNFTSIHWDVTEAFEIEGAVDLILHFASPASPADYLRLPLHTLRVGSIGTQNMLDLAQEKSARFLLASTSEVYGDPLVHPQHEDYWGNVNPVGPRGVYDEAKRYAEAVTTAYRMSLGTDCTIARIFNTYGPRMRLEDGRAIPNFISQSLQGKPLTISGDGTQTRSICYVDDMVTGILRLAASGHPGPMNLGNPEEMRVLTLARRIARLAGTDPPVAFIDRPVDDPSVRRPDTCLARAELGWAAVVGCDEGLLRTIAWFANRMGVRCPEPLSH